MLIPFNQLGPMGLFFPLAVGKKPPKSVQNNTGQSAKNRHPAHYIQPLKTVPAGHIKPFKICQTAAFTRMTFSAGTNIIFGRHHVGDWKYIGGIHKVKLA